MIILSLLLWKRILDLRLIGKNYKPLIVMVGIYVVPLDLLRLGDHIGIYIPIQVAFKPP